MNVWEIRIGLAIAFLCGAAVIWQEGNLHGAHKAELACANAAAAANVAALEAWQKAAAAQLDRDTAARAADAARAAKAADDAQAVADRFAAMKISIVKLAPAGSCKLSAAWIDAYNRAK